ncbi:MAG: phosphotransferase [Nocardioidaceae bacterium]
MTAAEQPTPGTRRLGEARTDGERTAEQVIRRVEAWSGREISYSPVHGGLQNENWRVNIADEDVNYFLKIASAGSDAYISRSVVHEAAQRAADLGISAQIVLLDPVQQIEIIEYLEGYRACTNGDLKTRDVPLQIADLYRTFHSAPLLSHTKTIFDMIDEHLEQAAQLEVDLPLDYPIALREYRAAREALEASGIDLAPCHNDPMPGNFLVKEGAPMKLVDFDFASNNDPACELAVLTTEMFYDDERTTQVIEHYYGSVTWPLVARIQVYGALADFKWGLWGVVRHVGAEWDFDYHKYGVWKLMRARIKMSDPRWGTWLASL